MGNEFWYLEGDPWTLTQRGLEIEKSRYFETIFTQSNGALGIRGYYEEDDPDIPSFREGYLAGITSELYGSARKACLKPGEVRDFPQMVTAPDLFSCRTHVHGEPFLMTSGKLEKFERKLHLREGLLQRRVEWVSPKGHRTELFFERFVSAADPGLLCQRITVIPHDRDGDLELGFHINGTPPTRLRHGNRSVPNYPNYHLDALAAGSEGNLGLLSLETRNQRYTLSIGSRIKGAKFECAEHDPLIPDKLIQNIRCAMIKDQPSCVERFIVLATTREGIEKDALEGNIRSRLDTCCNKGYDALLQEHRQVWDKRWETADIEIEGSEHDQMIVRFNTFHLIQSAPFHTDTLSIPARGYSFDRYQGHIFWDTETFMLPQFIFSLPAAARNLLAFRYNTLPAARENAASLGGKGAAFGFKLDPNEGKDASLGGPFTRILHQNGDIAYALDQYLRITGDRDFLGRMGIDIVVDTARFYAGEAEKDEDGRYHLNDMIGPDELYEPNRDNAYTNLLARFNLRLGARLLNELDCNDPQVAKSARRRLDVKSEEPAHWSEIADHLCIPTVPGLDAEVPLMDEFFMGKPEADMDGWLLNSGDPRLWKIPPKDVRNYRTVKQADVILAMFLLQQEFSIEQMSAAYDFYESRTLHSSSLSYNTHAVVAALLGRVGQAYDYFQRSAAMDLDNLHDATRDGLHSASQGGSWQAVVMGFCGMALNEKGLTFNPHLPPAWKAVRFSIVDKGQTTRVEVKGGKVNIEKT
ncbi:MAG: glycoside hydrolase family 65 protein [Deltaproteobacteria bacterium]|nr:glycoside hydrolase family 65 protein [Deltaproteobacteria bacterium]